MKNQQLSTSWVRLPNGVLKPRNLCSPAELEIGTDFKLRRTSAKHVREFWYWQKVYMSSEEWDNMRQNVEREAEQYVQILQTGSVSLGKIDRIISDMDDPAKFDPVAVRLAVLYIVDKEYQTGSVVLSEDDQHILAKRARFYLHIEDLQREIRSAYNRCGVDDQSETRALEVIKNANDWME